MAYLTSAMRNAESAARAALDDRTIFDAFPPALAPDETLKIAITSSRHGIGGVATDLTHCKAILDAATEQFPGRKVELHLFGGSRLALDGFEGERVIFHKDFFQVPAPGAHSLDPLQPLKGPEFVAECTRLRPHYVVALDAAGERQDWDVDDLVKIDSVAAAVVTMESIPQSGFYAARTVEILAPGKAPRAVGVPFVRSGVREFGSVYAESAFVAKLFGGEPKPFQSLTRADLGWGKETLSKLGYSPDLHSRLIYVHEGTSTEMKELTVEQIRAVMTATFSELARAGIDTSKLFFAVSPQPVSRPEIAKAYLESVAELGGTAVLLPDKTTLGQAKSVIALADAVLAADTYAYHAGTALGCAVSGHFSNPNIVPTRIWGHGVTVGPDMNSAVVEEILVKGDLSPAAIREIGINNALVISEGPEVTRAVKERLLQLHSSVKQGV